MTWIKFEHERGGWLNLDNISTIEKRKEPEGEILEFRFVQGDTLTVKQTKDPQLYEKFLEILQKEIDLMARVVSGELQIERGGTEK